MNDSILGHGLLDKSEGNEFNWTWVVNYDGKIALSNVQSIKMHKSDITLTVIAIAILAIMIVIGITSAVDFHPFGGKSPLGSGKL